MSKKVLILPYFPFFKKIFPVIIPDIRIFRYPVYFQADFFVLWLNVFQIRFLMQISYSYVFRINLPLPPLSRKPWSGNAELTLLDICPQLYKSIFPSVCWSVAAYISQKVIQLALLVLPAHTQLMLLCIHPCLFVNLPLYKLSVHLLCTATTTITICH